MDEDDIITPVLGHLCQMGVRDFGAAACVSQQFRRLCSLEMFWRPLCEQRWALFPDGPEYLDVANRAIADAGAGALASWRREYLLREQLLVKDYPCFCMGSNLGIGEPIGLHFFEPRYRVLIRMAMQGDRRFFFPAGRPSRGSLHYLCEAHNVRIYPDGRADLVVLPVHLCRVRQSWTEPVGNHPPLQMAKIEILPLSSPEAASITRRGLDNMRRRLHGPFEDDAGELGQGDEDEDEDEDEDDNDEDEDDEDDEDDDDDDEGEEGEGEEDDEDDDEDDDEGEEGEGEEDDEGEEHDDEEGGEEEGEEDEREGYEEEHAGEGADADDGDQSESENQGQPPQEGAESKAE